MPEPDPVLRAWAESGAMALTGRPEGPPLVAPGDPAGMVVRALEDLGRAVAARTGRTPALPGPEVLGERAAIARLGRNAPSSCGGGFRFLPTRDGHLGLTLARAADVDLLPALVESDLVRGAGEQPSRRQWQALERWSRTLPTREALSRARLLGLAGAAIPEPGVVASSAPTPAARVIRLGGDRRVAERPLVVDFSSLWAGPLCAHLLWLGGAEVVKVESWSRPDGARRGPAAFFGMLHQGHSSVAVRPDDPDDLRALRGLLARADLVIEASRPRALQRWGIDADAVVDGGTGWLSITAKGRASDTVGYGDDVAADAGLIVWEDGSPRLCGDAIADPLSGVVAAAAAAQALLRDRAALVEVSMRDAVLEALSHPSAGRAIVRQDATGWTVQDRHGHRHPVRSPRARRAKGTAPALGADNDRWLR
ncbi:CoA transferase [Nocardioides sp. cx-169]|uniref:CoA transferase n=1 Tax=Nocardioides sp. cx-169 TaxID=2899080 RepID=UPI001E5D50B2|nr:CoA transferase [Nocardioides sp. cx-169]MCD4532997.1 CoA transferase [Nocardioides sp. cx-169]